MFQLSFIFYISVYYKLLQNAIKYTRYIPNLSRQLGRRRNGSDEKVIDKCLTLRGTSNEKFFVIL